MPEPLTPEEARNALDAVDRGRREVIDEVGMPRWYWWSLAFGWVGLGFVIDHGRPWLTAAGTLAFGAAHAAMYGYVRAGRRRTPRLSVRADTVGRPGAWAVVAFLLAMAGATIGVSLLAAADGARHPVTMASVLVAVTIVLGGPAVMAEIRRLASRPS